MLLQELTKNTVLATLDTSHIRDISETKLSSPRALWVLGSKTPYLTTGIVLVILDGEIETNRENSKVPHASSQIYMALRKVTTDWDLIQDITGGLSRERYTIISYAQKEQYDLSFAEYCILDYIDQGSRMSKTEKGWEWSPKRQGYCIARPSKIAQHLGLAEITVKKALAKFKAKQWVDQLGAGLALNIAWKRGKDICKEESYSRFDNAIRRAFNLTFLEYATLLYIEQLIQHKDNHSSIVETGERITTKSKKEIGKGIGGVDARSLRRIVKELQRRKFLQSVSLFAKNGGTANKKAIYLLVDMSSIHLYELDTNGCIYYPRRTVPAQQVYAQ